MTIKQIFDEIANESSTNKKMDILRKYKDNALLKRVLYLANSKRVKFYIKQIPEYKSLSLTHTLDKALEGLDLLSSRTLTGTAGITHLASILSLCEPDDAYIIERIIEKDCKIGMGTTNMNKIFPKLIEDTPYMGAKAFEEKLAREIFKTGRGISQLKMDGRYCNAIIRAGEVDLESRQGEPTVLTGAKFLNELTKFEDSVLNGELTIDGISRYESNGIVASLVSIGKKKLDGENVDKEIAKFEKEHMVYQEALDSIRFTVWDRIIVDEYFEAKSQWKYLARFNALTERLKIHNPTMVSIVETRFVDRYEEAMSHFQEVLAKGYEGTILKSDNGLWKDGKPNWQVKMKLEMDVDLKIVGFNYGTGKNSEVISSLNATSFDGKVFTRPTGINEQMMDYITKHQEDLLGTILEVKCSGLSQDSEGNYSLLHPVFKSLRNDKNTCDSLEDIKAIENMAKGLTLV